MGVDRRLRKAARGRAGAREPPPPSLRCEASEPGSCGIDGTSISRALPLRLSPGMGGLPHMPRACGIGGGRRSIRSVLGDVLLADLGDLRLHLLHKDLVRRPRLLEHSLAAAERAGQPAVAVNYWYDMSFDDRYAYARFAQEAHARFGGENPSECDGL